MMESALDNPCYFTHTGLPLTGPVNPKVGVSSLKKRKGGSTSSLHVLADRNRRSFLRSFSPNVDDTRLLVLGNPRPSDMAPIETHRRHASAGVGPNTLSDMVQDMVLCTGNNDTFLAKTGNGTGSDDMRYVNTCKTLPPPGRRRHSLSSFMRPSSATLKLSETHKLRNMVADKGGMKCTEILDILLVYYGQSEGATQWANYLSHCFQQIAREQARGPFKIANVYIEDVLTGVMSFNQQEKMSHARLQIVIICPHFLTRLETNTSSNPGLSTLLQSGKVLTMLLGITEESITKQQRSVMAYSEHWRRLVVKDQDPAFVGDFLGVAMDIFSRSWHLQMAISQASGLDDKAHFSLLPKKIKMGQNKVIVSFLEPLGADDEICITLNKSGEKIEISSFKKKNPYTIQFTVPPTCLQVSLLMNVYVEKNGKSLGHRAIKCESRMRELDQILRSCDNPLYFMCQTLGLGPGEKELLDTFLVTSFQRNMPPDYSLLQPAGNRFCTSSEEYPTLLHFAARFGLEKLSWQLLECPGGVQACQIRNGSQLTPAEIAEKSGHVNLTNALKGYMQMTELTSMYHYLKGISDNQPGFSESNYLLPRPITETYSIPLHARPFNSPISPVTSVASSPFYTNLNSYAVPPSPVSVNLGKGTNYQFPPPPLPVSFSNYQVPPTESSLFHLSTPSTPVDKIPSFGGYMQMFSPSREGSANHMRTDLKLDLETESNCSKRDTLESIPTELDYNHGHSESKTPSHHTTPQDELAEIITDFKNNVHTIAEVENLVESWRNRNDVQQSFREKQEQLHQMRMEYERIQHSMKEKLKRPTPFERVRKFFSRGKSKHHDDHPPSESGKSQSSSDSNPVCHRLASSLSLHSSSSSSSGRVSSTSGVSVAESYAHSDYNERRNTGSSDSKYHRSKQGSNSSKEDINAMGNIRYNFPNSCKLNSDYVPASLQCETQNETGDRVSDTYESSSSNRGSWTSQEQMKIVMEEDSFSEHSESQNIAVVEIHQSDTNDSPILERKKINNLDKNDDSSNETEDSPLLCKIDANKNILVKYSVTKV